MKKEPKILIIEDDVATASLLVAILGQSGWDAIVAHSGEDALGKLDQYGPDVILLDLLLPGMNGFEVLKAVRKEKQYKKPVIILSNLSSDSDIRECFAQGATDYFVKSLVGVSDITAILEKYKV